MEMEVFKPSLSQEVRIDTEHEAQGGSLVCWASVYEDVGGSRSVIASALIVAPPADRGTLYAGMGGLADALQMSLRDLGVSVFIGGGPDGD